MTTDDPGEYDERNYVRVDRALRIVEDPAPAEAGAAKPDDAATAEAPASLIARLRAKPAHFLLAGILLAVAALAAWGTLADLFGRSAALWIMVAAGVAGGVVFYGLRARRRKNAEGVRTGGAGGGRFPGRFGTDPAKRPAGSAPEPTTAGGKAAGGGRRKGLLGGRRGGGGGAEGGGSTGGGSRRGGVLGRVRNRGGKHAGGDRAAAPTSGGKPDGGRRGFGLRRKDGKAGKSAAAGSAGVTTGGGPGASGGRKGRKGSGPNTPAGGRGGRGRKAAGATGRRGKGQGSDAGSAGKSVGDGFRSKVKAAKTRKPNAGRTSPGGSAGAKAPARAGHAPARPTADRPSTSTAPAPASPPHTKPARPWAQPKPPAPAASSNRNTDNHRGDTPMSDQSSSGYVPPSGTEDMGLLGFTAALGHLEDRYHERAVADREAIAAAETSQVVDPAVLQHHEAAAQGWDRLSEMASRLPLLVQVENPEAFARADDPRVSTEAEKKADHLRAHRDGVPDVQRPEGQ